MAIGVAVGYVEGIHPMEVSDGIVGLNAAQLDDAGVLAREVVYYVGELGPDEEKVAVEGDCLAEVLGVGTRRRLLAQVGGCAVAFHPVDEDRFPAVVAIDRTNREMTIGKGDGRAEISVGALFRVNCPGQGGDAAVLLQPVEVDGPRVGLAV